MKKILFILFTILLCSQFANCTQFVNAAEPKPLILVPDGVSVYGDTAYLSISFMDFDGLRNKFVGLQSINWKRAVIDLCSGGGSVFDAMAMISILQEQIDCGKIIEIRGRGIIASAALIVLQGATPGHRLLDPFAMIMFHEMNSFKMFSVETPTSAEDTAKIYRKIQDRIIAFIASKGTMPKEELDSKIRYKEFWMDAQEAVKYGFADKIWGR